MIRVPAGFGGEDRIKRYLDYYQPSYGVMMLSAGQAFSPASLFAAGEQGVWYDPSDYSSMFQNSTGTTAVTGLEQPVGLLLDKSGRGNHASQATSASRPVLSARYNLLTRTEEFDNAAWLKQNLTVSANTSLTTDPLGGNTADVLFETTASSQHIIYQEISITGSSALSFSVCMKAGTQTYGYVQVSPNGSPRYSALIDLTAGSILATVSSGSPTGTSASITPLGNGWHRITLTIAQSGGTMYAHAATANSATPSYSAASFPNYAGDITKGIYIWGADLRVTNDGVGLPAYQRVGAATAGSSTAAGTADYDSTGFPPYLRFDGTDDGLATSAIDFSATDKMTVHAGVRKLSDAAGGVVAELSINWTTVNGTFVVTAPDSANPQYGIAAKGTSNAFASIATYAAPITNVLTEQMDLAGSTVTDELSARVNGSAVTLTGASGPAGTGNFGNHPLYIGSRAGTSLRFNGRLYSLIVRGAAPTAAEITSTETWVNGKTLAY
jgi:hypothetical protein